MFKIGHSFSDYSRGLLLLLVFFFKFLEWWHASENYLKPAVQKSSLPNPPAPPRRAAGGSDLPRDVKLCPLCGKERVNATVLSVSGFVFCYTCINRHVQTSKQCPISKIPATGAHLIRLYDNQQ